MPAQSPRAEPTPPRTVRWRFWGQGLRLDTVRLVLEAQRLQAGPAAVAGAKGLLQAMPAGPGSGQEADPRHTPSTPHPGREPLEQLLGEGRGATRGSCVEGGHGAQGQAPTDWHAAQRKGLKVVPCGQEAGETCGLGGVTQWAPGLIQQLELIQDQRTCRVTSGVISVMSLQEPCARLCPAGSAFNSHHNH